MCKLNLNTILQNYSLICGVVAVYTSIGVRTAPPVSVSMPPVSVSIGVRTAPPVSVSIGVRTAPPVSYHWGQNCASCIGQGYC